MSRNISKGIVSYFTKIITFIQHALFLKAVSITRFYVHSKGG